MWGGGREGRLGAQSFLMELFGKKYRFFDSVDSEWLSTRTSFQLEYEFLDTSKP